VDIHLGGVGHYLFIPVKVNAICFLETIGETFMEDNSILNELFYYPFSCTVADF
jgi:hypothetical protein